MRNSRFAAGFGSAVAQRLSRTFPVKMECMGIHDEFGQFGWRDELIDHFGLSSAHIADVARRVLA